jgi:hypothetical protein
MSVVLLDVSEILGLSFASVRAGEIAARQKRECP